ncbi:hypothetical protein DDB_G0282113 [Dictyostelium discoideum AX4]|uniref:Uncharacterized protein n=1 Tax=Dictyostelium discoideum TaxID=44689 RepID=Q54SZ5_DICDI|nr:hypothetical protein DDB_G0282113 [Dictyostelium discoideum AX4]EAL66382.1 hypothetical protein DDB_G0282113 [Dictyostelium discoideum AX4]|eukprot:XP_640360.1 hypothetical protein DDB_G0282113 [Dictyostelium discoideum AX4]
MDKQPTSFATESLKQKNKEENFKNKEIDNCKQLEFEWSLNKIIDRTKYSKEKELGQPIILSNNNKTSTRHERVQGDEFPPIRILSNQPISFTNQDEIIEWSVLVNCTHGFIEVGVYLPELDTTYLLKGFKNEAQIENGREQIKTFEFGEKISTGDKITISLQQQQNNNNKTIKMNIIKNDKPLGTPFNDIPTTSKIYPMIGLNDGGDQVSII